MDYKIHYCNYSDLVLLYGEIYAIFMQHGLGAAWSLVLEVGQYQLVSNANNTNLLICRGG